MCQTQAKASDLPIYNIFVRQKLLVSNISDNVIARGLWFGAPLMKNPGYAMAQHACIVEKRQQFLVPSLKELLPPPPSLNNALVSALQSPRPCEFAYDSFLASLRMTAALSARADCKTQKQYWTFQLKFLHALVVVVVVAHISLPIVTGQRQTLTVGRSAHFSLQWLQLLGWRNPQLLIGVSIGLMFPWISSNFCPLILLLVHSHQAEVIIVKRLIQGCNNVIRVRVEPISCNQGRRKNDLFILSATAADSLT